MTDERLQKATSLDIKTAVQGLATLKELAATGHHCITEGQFFRPQHSAGWLVSRYHLDVYFDYVKFYPTHQGAIAAVFLELERGRSLGEAIGRRSGIDGVLELVEKPNGHKFAIKRPDRCVEIAPLTPAKIEEIEKKIEIANKDPLILPKRPRGA